MRYSPTDPREDDPQAVSQLEGRHKGATALIVLGGNSAERWAELYAQLRPGVLICANGANGLVCGADYWLCCENMKRAYGRAQKGDADSIALMEMFYRESATKTKMVSHWSWELLKDTNDCIKIRRQGYELNEIPKDFTFRRYGMGYLAGWILKHREAGKLVHVGTVGLQCLHHAGILGCSEIHTIGYDLMFKNPEEHHAYPYPRYEVDVFRTPHAFVTYKGVPTQWTWIESAQFLKEIEWRFKADGIRWHDHSDGLLKIEGLNCANRL